MKIKIWILLLLTLGLLGCKGLNIFSHEYAHPADSDLEKMFHKKKDDYETLVSLFIEDSENKSEYFWIGREKFTLEQLPENRKEAYLELFNSLRILSISRDYYHNPKTIRLVVAVDSKDLNGHGSVIEVHIKGYFYSPDNVSNQKVNFGETDWWSSGYKKIDENWFIFHEIRSGKPE